MTTLETQYKDLCTLMGMIIPERYSNINIYIRKILRQFMESHERVAVYCYGYHTQMLMSDFVAELRNIICIIDNGSRKNDSVFKIIKDEEIDEYYLDGVIISSFVYKDEIKRGLRNNHKSVDVLDIYKELENYGLYLEEEFFIEGPYQVYSHINRLWQQCEDGVTVDILRKILKEYVSIKDFRMASEIAKRIYAFSAVDEDKKIHEAINDLYDEEINSLAESGRDNTLMLCLDGMRRCDFVKGKLKKTYALLKESSYIYTNAYSYSTMTYESLVPVYSENTDQRTKYYLEDEVKSSDCRFMKTTLDDKRFVAVYGDGNHYIFDESIKYSGNSQTVTEKLWDFVLDSREVNNGLFYLHEMYESHYSFANPYTENKIISNGSAMLFDYLPQNKGKLRTDYKKQQEDALRYLDDTLYPFLLALPCNLVLFADHGNLVLEPGTELKDIKKLQLTASEEWIQIPLVIRVAGDKSSGENGDLISLMEINDIMLAVMSGRKFVYYPKEYIKIGRSEIYNQQFKELYRMILSGYNGEAFEGFIFSNGYKLLVYSNGKKELFCTNNDTAIDNDALIDELYNKVKGEISIWGDSIDE